MSDNNLDRMMKNDVALERLEEVCRERGYRLVENKNVLKDSIIFNRQLNTVFVSTYVTESNLRNAIKQLEI